MDKTAVLFEDFRTQTIDFKGRKHVIMKSTGFSLMCITSCMGVWADGRKATPLIIHKGKDRGIITPKTGPLLTTTQAKSWVKSELLVKWIDAIFTDLYISVVKCIV